ncbi:MAG: hypothetical protein II304_01910 [Bacteroidales bacterium]|nr:hypothetical protein [Bacteroidales bacterium]
MGILPKGKQQEKITTKNFYFGTVEAEGENKNGLSLVDYFEDYLNILGDIDQQRFIFVGRKGTGKSAIAKYLKDRSDKENNSFAAILKMSDFSKEKVIQNSEENISCEMIFEWLILVNLTKLIVKSNSSTYTNEYTKLKKFLERNTGSVDIDKLEINEKIISQGVNFDVLKHISAFKTAIENNIDKRLTKAPFYKMIDPLKEILKKILSFQDSKDNEFWLMFDDLDVNYKINDETSNDTIMNLLRIVKRYNTEILKDANVNILVFIRKDIKDIIVSKYNDSAKLFSSYSIDINWYTEDNDENGIPLKRMINKRIGLNFKEKNIQYNENNPWNNLFYLTYYSDKPSFKYVLDLTFYRPRDVITFLSEVTKFSFDWPISENNFSKIVKNYLQTNFNEISSELNLYFNDNDKGKIFEIFKLIAQSDKKYTREEVENKLVNLDCKLQSKKIVDLLLDYGLLMFLDDNGNVRISYREADLERYSSKDQNIALTKSLYYYYKFN